MNDNTFEHQPVAWTPSPEVVERAQMTRFMRQINVSNFDELYRFSIENVEDFTAEVLKFLDIKFNPPYEKLLDTSDGAPFPRWCVGGGLNIVSHCVDRWQTDETRDQPAIIWEGEEGEVRQVTYAELQKQVELCAAGLRHHGLGKGDAIGIHLPMMIETVVALLAVGRIGAIAVPVFSGYGVEAIASRMNAVGAKAIFTCDGFPRRGKRFNAYEIAGQAIENSPTIEKVFIVRRSAASFAAAPAKHIRWRSLLEAGRENHDVVRPRHIKSRPNTEGSLSYLEPTLAEDALIILYTSGTTGKPKGIAHTHAGFPVKAAQDMAFGTDVGRGTRISWTTDIGWMMGPWLIYGALLNGATVCIYDGAPDYPSADRMWKFCAAHRVEILGISPTLIRSLATKGDEPPKKHDLSHLRAFASTGEPWNPAPWWWLFETVGGSRLPIINYSGGTEISGGILMNNPLLPIKPCGFSAACPGIDAAILDDAGDAVAAGKVGELAIRKPWIGMARGFWREPERYLETYWSRLPGVWIHGDWAMRDADGHWFILGRSDDTLKIAGKRVGPAEVESILVAHASIAEAAVIGVPDDLKGTKMVAFCVLRNAVNLSPPAAERKKDAANTSEDSMSVVDAAVKMTALEMELKQLVARDLGKPLAPSLVHFVSALPKTRSGKVMRRVLRAAYLGEDAGDLSALENPSAIEVVQSLKHR